MAWTPLKAVYIAQPRSMAKPATCSVRSSSDRRTCRNFARKGRSAATDGIIECGVEPQAGFIPAVTQARQFPGRLRAWSARPRSSRDGLERRFPLRVRYLASIDDDRNAMR